MAKMASEFRPLTVSLIAAVARNGGIGRDGGLLCPLPADLRRFKQLTVGHPVIMGRRTFESLPKGALPNRRNIVLSRQPEASFAGTERYASLEEALSHCQPDEEVYIIGGASVYKEALPLADRLCLTLIDDTPAQADAFFPEVDPQTWKEVSRESYAPDEKHVHGYCFVDYARR